VPNKKNWHALVYERFVKLKKMTKSDKHAFNKGLKGEPASARTRHKNGGCQKGFEYG